jgi:hypothetical protein
VPSHTAYGSKDDLRDQESDPTGEQRTVDVNQQAREFRLENAGQEVGLGESDENCGNDQENQRAKENVFTALAD